MTSLSSASVVAEIAGAELGDARRTRRLKKMAERFAERPGATVAEAMVTPAEGQGAYQLLNCDDVEADAIQGAHAACTLERCRKEDEVHFLHDTTDNSFGGRAARAGLGPLNDGGQGFRAHLCFAVTPARKPLGTVAWQLIARDGTKKEKRGGKNVKRPERESLRWHEVLERAAALAKGKCRPVHVMDSEADDYDLLALLVKLGERFVIRSAQDRRVAEGGLLSGTLPGARVRLEREVLLSPRAPKEAKSRSKRNQPRGGRLAQLEIASRSVTLVRPSASGRDQPAELTVNVVHVREVDPPADVDPVEWILLTSEPVRTADDVARVVDAYRSRWTIEEFFKALKTGCGYERAQLESFGALSRLLALLLPVAWQLLLIREVAKEQPDAPATLVFTPEQLTVMAALPDARLPPEPTVGEAHAALARLGSHLPHNGPPGWIVLGRGLRRVAECVQLLVGLRKRDQS